MAATKEDTHEMIAPAPAAQHYETRTVAADDDEIAPEAIGGTNADLPPGYYRSASFIGTVVVCLV